MDQKEEFLTYLKERKNSCLEQAQELTNEARKDESKFFRAKANIYDIYVSLYQVSEKVAGGDPVKLTQEFHKRADQVPESWRKAHALAKEHQDVARVLMEEAKLEAAEEVVKEFDRIHA